jgi:hypothetical protein
MLGIKLRALCVPKDKVFLSDLEYNRRVFLLFWREFFVLRKLASLGEVLESPLRGGWFLPLACLRK